MYGGQGRRTHGDPAGCQNPGVSWDLWCCGEWGDGYIILDENVDRDGDGGAEGCDSERGIIDLSAVAFISEGEVIECLSWA